MPAEIVVGLEEGGGAVELVDGEARHRFHLVGRPHRLFALHVVEVGVVVVVDEQRRDHRAEATRVTAAIPARSGASGQGTAASDSQR